MTPEELAYQEGFLYPLYLILIAGLITGGLIPYFNRLHGQKLKEIESKREEAQKRIDREREDYRFELEIKERVVNKVSERHVWFIKKFGRLNRQNKPMDIEELYADALDELNSINVPLSDLLTLYFQNQELINHNHRIFKMMNDSLLIAFTKPNSEERKKELEEFLKKFEITLEKKEIEAAVASKADIFEPTFLISGETGGLTRKILDSNADIRRSDN